MNVNLIAICILFYAGVTRGAVQFARLLEYAWSRRP